MHSTEAGVPTPTVNFQLVVRITTRRRASKSYLSGLVREVSSSSAVGHTSGYKRRDWRDSYQVL